MGNEMEVAGLVLPVFAIIVTGWLAGWSGYISRSLADGLVHFAYNVAMPALLVVTIAQEPAANLLEWRFLAAFGGGTMLGFALVYFAARLGAFSSEACHRAFDPVVGTGSREDNASKKRGRSRADSTMIGLAATMTNTGFVALPI